MTSSYIEKRDSICISEDFNTGDKKTDECLLLNRTWGFDAGHAAALEDLKPLVEALESWLSWEAGQIKKDGPYVGKAINELINNGNKALAHFTQLTKPDKDK